MKVMWKEVLLVTLRMDQRNQRRMWMGTFGEVVLGVDSKEGLSKRPNH